MDLFVLDKIVIGLFKGLSEEKIFTYLVGAMIGVYLYYGTKQAKKKGTK